MGVRTSSGHARWCDLRSGFAGGSIPWPTLSRGPNGLTIGPLTLQVLWLAAVRRRGPGAAERLSGFPRPERSSARYPEARPDDVVLTVTHVVADAAAVPLVHGGPVDRLNSFLGGEPGEPIFEQLPVAEAALVGVVVGAYGSTVGTALASRVRKRGIWTGGSCAL